MILEILTETEKKRMVLLTKEIDKIARKNSSSFFPDDFVFFQAGVNFELLKLIIQLESKITELEKKEKGEK